MADQLPRGAASKERHQYGETDKLTISGASQPPSSSDNNRVQNRRPNTLPLSNQHDPSVSGLHITERIDRDVCRKINLPNVWGISSNSWHARITFTRATVSTCCPKDMTYNATENVENREDVLQEMTFNNFRLCRSSRHFFVFDVGLVRTGVDKRSLVTLFTQIHMIPQCFSALHDNSDSVTVLKRAYPSVSSEDSGIKTSLIEFALSIRDSITCFCHLAN